MGLGKWDRWVIEKAPTCMADGPRCYRIQSYDDDEAHDGRYINRDKGKGNHLKVRTKAYQLDHSYKTKITMHNIPIR